MIVQACKEIPERERIALRAVSARIDDIANHLLHQYKIDQSDTSSQIEEKTPVLLSVTLLQLLTEKKFQYQRKRVEFDHHFQDSEQFAFILIEHSAFKRMVSNLINNAVDSFEGKPGKVTLSLKITGEWCSVIVQDNGKGMSSVLIEKIMNNMTVTEGKVDGNGIGLTQVRETLGQNNGTMSIRSEIREGTAVMLKFPRVTAPSWVAEAIKLAPQALIIILDDDSSIHGAWDSRFESILKQAPELQVQHFKSGQSALEFIQTLVPAEKKNVFLLTDYELLNQDLNGLDVVEKSQIEQSILVTSHYDNVSIQTRALALKTKILPKLLASDVPIYIDETKQQLKTPSVSSLRKVDAIWVDDDKAFTNNIQNYVLNEKIVDYFNHPDELREKLAAYSKDTRIILDNNFSAPCKIKGTEFAIELHELGYTRLYLISGDTFQSGELPDYLVVLSKRDIMKIKDELN